MRSGLVFKEFPDRSSASAAASAMMAESLRATLLRKERASLVVSGGSTPKECFEALSSALLDWTRVCIVPSDERWVSPDNESSNELLIRNHLMQGPAAAAQLLSLFRSGFDPDRAPAVIGLELHGLERPFSCVLLGMGEDGHFASLFPDFEGLSRALDTGNTEQCVIVRTAASPFPRISLTLSALLDSPMVMLLIFGAAKRLVLQKAMDRESGYPVEALLSQMDASVAALWAP